MLKYKHLNKFLYSYKNNQMFFTLSRCFTNKIENLQDQELNAFNEVGTNLFENNQHKPVNTKILLKEYRNQNKKNRTEFHKQRQLNSVHDSDLGFSYKKLKLNESLLGKLFTAASKSRKNNENQIIIEGWRLIQEAINCGLKLKTLIFSKKENLEPIVDLIKNIQEAEIYKVPQETLRIWSTLTTCPGLIAIFERCNGNLKAKDENERNTAYPITVVCDNIREPNNLGSIIRTCAAIPCHEVIVMKGCCDPWDVKALRGGCGGQFRINIKDNMKWEDLWNTLKETKYRNISVLIAESNVEKVNNYPSCIYHDLKMSNEHNYVIIGGETHGVSEDAYRYECKYFVQKIIETKKVF